MDSFALGNALMAGAQGTGQLAQGMFKDQVAAANRAQQAGLQHAKMQAEQTALQAKQNDFNTSLNARTAAANQAHTDRQAALKAQQDKNAASLAQGQQRVNQGATRTANSTAVAAATVAHLTAETKRMVDAPPAGAKAPNLDSLLAQKTALIIKTNALTTNLGSTPDPNTVMTIRALSQQRAQIDALIKAQAPSTPNAPQQPAPQPQPAAQPAAASTPGSSPQLGAAPQAAAPAAQPQQASAPAQPTAQPAAAHLVGTQRQFQGKTYTFKGGNWSDPNDWAVQ